MNFTKYFKKNDVVDSVLDNFKTKTTNPFFGTLIIVWLFHNWKLVYTVFNFDEKTKLDKKVEFIAKYLDGWGFVWNLLLCVLIAFGVLVLTYVFLGFSRFISERYEEKILPWIHSLNGDSKIVTKKKYLDLEDDWRGIKKNYQAEKELRLEAEGEVNKLKQRMESSFKEIEKTSLENSLVRDEAKIEAFMSGIGTNKDLESYIRHMILIKKGEPLPPSPILVTLLKYELIDRKMEKGNVVIPDFYILTDFGKRYLRYYTIVNSKN
ncbi:hypothetical protein DF185_08015 [Marinifilum breve]|uniref:Uncharacterized protein n=1 Tax=Marinifilum breve TaxID=2184082 RepID=A0A2V3ZYS0_9BACT|nr:hypothetical protein [Marinifilum breve]PXY01421.1 hypothetical protein DF185_08015 [Marinifilum breve]